MHKGSGRFHSLAGKMHFPSDKLLWFSFLLHTNAENVWTVLCVVFTSCSLPIASRMIFPFLHACLFLLLSVGFLSHCQGTVGKVQVPKRYVLKITQLELLGSQKPDRGHFIWSHTLTPWASCGHVPSGENSQEESLCSVVTCRNILIWEGQPMPGHEVRTEKHCVLDRC